MKSFQFKLCHAGEIKAWACDRNPLLWSKHSCVYSPCWDRRMSPQQPAWTWSHISSQNGGTTEPCRYPGTTWEQRNDQDPPGSSWKQRSQLEEHLIKNTVSLPPGSCENPLMKARWNRLSEDRSFGTLSLSSRRTSPKYLRFCNQDDNQEKRLNSFTFIALVDEWQNRRSLPVSFLFSPAWPNIFRLD